MEMTLSVDGYMLSVSTQNGSVVFYVRDSGNCGVFEVALTPTQATSLGFGVMAAVEEFGE